MTRIVLSNITKQYDNGFLAVNNISLDIHSGEFLVLLGPSGCGKSTTLRMIAGLEHISSGDLMFDGEYMNNTEPKDRDVGMVFQNYALYPHLTVFDNLAFPLQIRRENKTLIRKRVEEVAAVTGLKEFLERKPRQLSGGQRQRVALGRAIIRKPRVFLFDEPLSNLDAQLRTQMRTEISRLQKMVGSTAVYVTHDQTEAMTMGDRIVVMKDGIIQQIGTPAEVYNNPANLFVAGFLGSPAMNIIEGTLLNDGESPGFHENPDLGREIKVLLPRRIFQHPPPHNERVLLGIRPEHLSIKPFDGFVQQSSFTGTIERYEYLGHEVLLYIQTALPAPLKIIRIASLQEAVRIGAQLTVYMRPDALHVFNSQGQRL